MCDLTEEQVEVWRKFNDLQTTFPNVLNGDIKGYLNWWRDYFPAEREVRLGSVPATNGHKCDVLMIWPGVRLPGWKSMRLGNNFEAVSLNHGLASISANLKKHGYTVKLIDLRELGGWNEVSIEIKKYLPKIIAIGFYSVDEPYAKDCIEIAKKCYPDVPIIGGGAHLTITQTNSYPNVDCVVWGEGEEVMVDLVEEVKDDKRIPSFIDAPSVKNLDMLPFVDRELFCPFEKSSPFLPLLPTPFFSVNWSKGCRWRKCTFCHESNKRAIFKSYRVRSPENCIEEIKTLMPVGSLMVHDDLFPYAHWCEKLVHLWHRRGLPRIPFWNQMRADFISNNESLIEKLAEIGLTWVSLGVESASQRILDFLNKGTTVEQNYKAVEILHNNSVNIFMDIISGVPTETMEDIEKTGEYLKNTRPAWLSLSVYTCYPGSLLYSYCIEHDLFLNEHYSMTRYPYERKIRGIDYEELFKKLGHFQQYKGGLREWTK